MKSLYPVVRSIAAVLLACAMVASHAMAHENEMTAFMGATLVNSDGSASVENSVILVKDDRIFKVGEYGQVDIPDAARRANLQGKWIMPGLVDTHTHLVGRGSIYDQSNVLDLKAYVTPKQARDKARQNIERTLARYLRSGVTTIVDIGGPASTLKIRDAARTLARSPRVFMAGPIVGVASANDPASDEDEDPAVITIASKKDARRAIRKLAALQVDIVKLYMTPQERSGVPFATALPWLKAAIDEAHDLGMRVSAHALRYDIARQAVAAGVDVLVHGVMDATVEDDFLELLAKNNTIYTTTLIVFDGGPGQILRQDVVLSRAELDIGDQEAIGSFFDLAHLPATGIANSFHEAKLDTRMRLDVLLPNLKRVQDAGIPIALGTDAGLMGIVHGATIFRELELMTIAGLSTQQVITAASLGGARFIGKEKDLGSITVGKFADMVVLNANPLDDIRNVQEIDRVIKGGVVFEPAAILILRPSEVVQRKVNAYNAHDVEALLDAYTDTATISGFPDQDEMANRKKIRGDYERALQHSPELHVQILDRVAVGDFVIDHQQESASRNSAATESIRIYLVEDSKIRREWMISPR